MKELKIINKNIEEIKEYENNAKEHPDWQIEQIANSINEFGFNDPIAINTDNQIIEGHGRLLAAKQLGLSEIPCIVLDGLTEVQERAYIIAHNKTTMNTDFDLDRLQYELNALKVEDFDLSLTGFSDDEIDRLLNQVDDIEENQEELKEDYEEIEVEKIVIKTGDYIELGRHRLLCGDSTNENDIKKLLNGNVPILLFTDPPYGMKKEKDGVANDNLNFNDLLEFNKKWIPLSLKYIANNGSWYCWGIDEPLMDIYSEIIKPLIKENKITFRNLITWNKGNGQGQTAEKFRMYPVADEKCLFIMKGVQGFNDDSENYFEGWEPIRLYLLEEIKKCGGVKKSDKILGNQMGKHYYTKSQWLFPTEDNYNKLQKWAIENNVDAFKKEYEEIKKEYEEIKKSFYETRAYFNNTHDNMNNVWHFDRVVGEDREETGGHATPKPIELCARAIKSSSRENDSVLDLFGGSGSTLIACEQLNRSAYLMELEPKWVQVIIERYLKFTNNKFMKINGEEIDWLDYKVGDNNC